MRMLVAGEWCDASDGATIAVLNPGSGALIDRVPAATEADVERAVAAAQEGRRAMQLMPAHARGAALVEAAARLEADRETIARVLAEENGKPIRQTRGEVDAVRAHPARLRRGGQATLRPTGAHGCRPRG